MSRYSKHTQQPCYTQFNHVGHSTESTWRSEVQVLAGATGAHSTRSQTPVSTVQEVHRSIGKASAHEVDPLDEAGTKTQSTVQDNSKKQLHMHYRNCFNNDHQSTGALFQSGEEWWQFLASSWHNPLGGFVQGTAGSTCRAFEPPHAQHDQRKVRS